MELSGGLDPPSTQTIVESNEQAAGESSDVIVIPGTGHKNANETAHAIAPAFKEYSNTNILSIDKGSDPTPESVELAILDRLRSTDPSNIILYGVSAGGKMALEVAPGLIEEFPDASLSIILSSTPFDADSAYDLNSPIKRSLTTVANKLNLSGGPATIFLTDFAVRSKHYINDDDSIDWPRMRENAKLAYAKLYEKSNVH